MTTPRPSETSLTFIGTATTLLRLGRFRLLTDPNFLHRGRRAALGWGLSSRRRTDPALSIGELPALDAILLSHLHGGHFDRVARAGLDHGLPVVTTPHARDRLRRWGFEAATGLDTWQSWEMGDGAERIRVTAVPARHGPRLLHRMLPTVQGSIVDLQRDGRRVLRLYITGDTVTAPELTEIRDRVDGIDVMVAHLGGTRIGGVLLTLDARQGADLVGLVRPGRVVPVHYDDYDVFRSPLTHFLDEMRARGDGDRVRVVQRGETLALPPSTGRAATLPGPGNENHVGDVAGFRLPP
ncbi:MBL fold metallo-hydrolase [Pseudonocardia parietis]|uniref:L-ascorbate metabolism protein UlaG (Beta-lactamase superfamily) n=1 Tax=Pseudonocardia parietis TaxID=570936 RepID=A0ABS4VVC4_9PSEU|nr:MBL fold metallo-hydrolase [Pseudonocardia parietis]MBP2367873.1 L-ascorbate metabolism protein UlaG (beta-lactamase superfamily) [Pseudonocardia parietis]